MDKFTVLESVAAPLRIINIDTDMIIPKQYLKTIKRTGLGTGLFSEMRYREDGSENPDFVLNQPAYRNAKILVAPTPRSPSTWNAKRSAAPTAARSPSTSTRSRSTACSTASTASASPWKRPPPSTASRRSCRRGHGLNASSQSHCSWPGSSRPLVFGLPEPKPSLRGKLDTACKTA
jgi:hypothetical protein